MTKKDKKSVEEKQEPKSKQTFLLPEKGMVVEAETLSEAVEKSNKKI